MTCAEFRHTVYTLFDGEAAPDETRAVEEHAASCASCRALLAEIRQMFAGMKGLRLPEPAHAYWGSILPRIHEAVGSGRRTSLGDILVHAVLPASATLAALIIGMFLLPLQHQAPVDEISEGLRGAQAEDIQLLEEQFSFTLSSDPLSPVDAVDLRANGDRDQILSIFRSSGPALSSVEDEHMRAFEGMSDAELGRLFDLADNTIRQ